MQIPPAPTMPELTGDPTQDTQATMNFQQQMNTWNTVVNALLKAEEKRGEAMSGAINRAAARIG